MKNIINKNILNISLYLLIVNLVTFFCMWLDKRKAKKGKRRIPENTLFTLAFLGGGIGGVLGMHIFRHKTKKARFIVGFPLILILEILIFIFLCM